MFQSNLVGEQARQHEFNWYNPQFYPVFRRPFTCAIFYQREYHAGFMLDEKGIWAKGFSFKHFCRGT
jgi:hypothetical protein